MAGSVILGTAGHIDHGKTSLIQALTGIDTDRLPEEKRRGITIELGFAHTEIDGIQFGIVDVPGHEKFVRHMLAGATGMDVAMLVVACDDGVKPQTREHLDILKLLNVPAGVVALTKCDLLEPDWIELVRAEVAELVAGSFLADAEIIPVSARSGQGLVELRAALKRAADQAERFHIQRDTTLPFRLSVDRVFTLAGLGAVVTGTVHSGQLNVGDQIEIQPAGLIARVRQLHNHGREVTQVVERQRAAINLAGVHHDAIERGFEIAAIGLLQPSRLMTVELTLLPTVSHPLKDRTRIKLHLGTAEIPAIVRLLDRSSLEPGATANVQLYLGQMSVSLWGQPFVIRRESPAETIGGGHVLHPSARPIKKPTASMLELLNSWGSEQEIKRLEAAIYFADRFTETPHHWARLCGTDPHPEWVDQLIQTGAIQRVPISPEQTVVIHRLAIQQWEERIERLLTKMHQRNPMQASFPISQLVQTLDRRKLDADVIQLALDSLLGNGRVERTADRISLAGAGPKLSKAEQQLLSKLAAQLQTAGLGVPTVKELQQEHSKMEKSVVPLLNLLVESGVAARINAEMYLHTDTLESAKQRLRDVFSRQPRLPMAELREALQTTRKYAVPLAEYLDQIGFTRRNGDLRSLKT